MTFHQHHTGDGVDAIADRPTPAANTFTTATLPPGAEPADGVDLEYRRLFASFGQNADGHISRKELFSKLHQCGILVDDPRIRETVRILRELDEPDKITFAQFKQIARQNSSLMQNCLSLMSSCGMYDFSGEFAFTIGLPAKSGVSGALMLVVPEVMGICVWSPRLDDLGNSVRGIEFCKQLVNRYNFHIYDRLTRELNHKRDPRLKKNQSRIEGVVNLVWAASQGDLSEAQKLAASGVDLDGADYDGRTALHLAASEGQAHIVEYLIEKEVNLNPIDRWGGSPLSDARRNNHEAVISMLEAALEESGTRVVA